MGPIHVIESFVPAMVRASRGGALVNVSSAAGLLAGPVPGSARCRFRRAVEVRVEHPGAGPLVAEPVALVDEFAAAE